jgi:hypothetical protein
METGNRFLCTTDLRVSMLNKKSKTILVVSVISLTFVFILIACLTRPEESVPREEEPDGQLLWETTSVVITTQMDGRLLVIEVRDIEIEVKPNDLILIDYTTEVEECFVDSPANTFRAYNMEYKEIDASIGWKAGTSSFKIRNSYTMRRFLIYHLLEADCDVGVPVEKVRIFRLST